MDTAVATLRTASGKLCQISNSRRATYGYDQRIEAHGEKGLLRAGNVTATTVELCKRRRLQHRSGAAVLPGALRRGVSLRTDAFIAAVTAGQLPKPNGEDGLQALLLADAATRSAQNGEAVRFG